MKSDLPKLMAERNLDALCVIGPDGMGAANTAFTYFVGAAHVTQGYIVVKRVSGSRLQVADEPTNLKPETEQPETFVVHGTMERDEAAKTGFHLINKADYNMPELIKQNSGNRLLAEVDLIRRLFADLGIHGRVGFYGAEAVGKSFALLTAINKAGFCEVVTEYEKDVITEAQQTKDAAEAALIRETCRLTEDVIAATKRFLQSHAVQGETLVKADGAPLTIGDAKTFIRREVAVRGMTMDDCIFAIGRDAAVPHSGGNPGDVIQLGKTIIFDIWPAGPGGYHSDITRTWCLGYAPDEVKLTYEQVMLVHATTEQSFSAEKFTWEFNHQACEMFDEFGHDTLLKNFSAKSGYIHGLGHGFGLAVHEAPNMGIRGMRPDERIRPGTIICNEPGLYYPDKGWGVRCEDDYWLNPATMAFERLTEIDRMLVVEM